MKNRVCLLALLSTGLLGSAPAAAPQAEKVDFNRDVRPILSDNCFKCHGPDAGKRKAGLRLDQRDEALAPLKSGATAIIPGRAAQSALVQRITHADRSERMPPEESGKSLTPAQIDTLRRWVAEGAEYKPHWAFIPPARPAVPAVKNTSWPRNDIDRFLLARLEREKLAPSPEADRVTLLRRLSFDLTGLPPTPAEVDAFVADTSRDAVEKAVDRLLASPHHGEKLAIYWLDLVRYANSRGYHSDNPRNVDHYRDYVIRAFNENMPFDRFTIEQLAGDLLPEPTIWQRVASCYNKLNLTTEEGGAQAREYEAKSNADRVRSVSGAWMGATMGCAECHDHKFDPFSTRDFYRMAAFFADVKESAIGDKDPGIPVPNEEQERALRSFDESIVALKKKLEGSMPELDAARAEWERTALEPEGWSALETVSTESNGRATFTVEEGGSVLVSGNNPGQDVYTVTLKSGLKEITGIRLEALAHASHPGSGPGRAPNGNFVLTKFRVQSGGKDVPLAKAAADFSQEGWPVAAAIDAKAGTGWAILPSTGKDHGAVFETKVPLVAAGPVVVIMEFKAVYDHHAIGRFRLSATSKKNPSEGLPKDVHAILSQPAEKRSEAQKKRLADYHRSISPLLVPLRAELVGVEKKKADYLKPIPTCLVAVATAPRTVRVLPRGNWLDGTGEVVTPGVPEFMGALKIGDRRSTRLDLAKWLVSRENPLTARVFVNRLWMLFFGVGLSKRLDDVGGQGEPPVHPELLDWLAVEFMEGAPSTPLGAGWNVRHVVRKMVTSAAYRQSSKPAKELRERDPDNRLVARQSRWRLEAELVRDNALAVSGLLVRTIGGPSAKPYQPKGYWFHLNFPKREWQNDGGENQHRRGLYTWWQRTFMHPSLMAFDASSREECCAERTRSNIPQQALVLLNDPTYVEAARVFAYRIVSRAPAKLEERIAWAFREALSRKPAEDEVRVLADLHAKHLEKYRADPSAAQAAVSVGQAPAVKDGNVAELAAWTSVARALLNLHETITRF